MPVRLGSVVRTFSMSRLVMCGLVGVLGASPALGAVTVEQALKLTPVQKDVEFDRPTTAAEIIFQDSILLSLPSSLASTPHRVPAVFSQRH